MFGVHIDTVLHCLRFKVMGGNGNTKEFILFYKITSITDISYLRSML